MVTWERAFKGAVLILLYFIVWAAIATPLLVAGFVGMMTTLIGGGVDVTQSVVLMVIGAVIIFLGAVVAGLKVAPEIIAKEVKGE